MTRRSSTLIAIVGAALGAALYYAAYGPEVQPAQLPSFPSYFMQPAFVDDAFSAVGSVSARPDAAMVLVNHHLLAPRLIAQALAVVATESPATVVLISPDHFHAGAAPITSVIARWPTPYGTLEPASESISALASAGLLHLQTAPFVWEHGITNITMFIGRALPQARIVPILVRADARGSDLDALAEAITRLPGPVVLVGSFDFTHDGTDSLAAANDARSLTILRGGDPGDADGIVADSPRGLRLLMSVGKLRRESFHKLAMSNSARMLGDLSRSDVTSYLTGYWAP